jgi:hypothetical protein
MLALGSILALGDIADTAFVTHQLPPQDTGERLDIGTYGIIALITDAARGFGFVVHALAGVVGIILVVLAVAAVFMLLLGVLLYLTGRGIGRHSGWARIVAILMSAGLALGFCSLLPPLWQTRQDLAPFSALPIGFCLYALWVLIWRFA